jgi:diadenosine tetraphosphate (Ap4A) HIT family hydrolase
MTLIHDRVDSARRGENPHVIACLPSGWAVLGDVQPLPGYCLLLPDPVVASLNDLGDRDAGPHGRAAFLLDMVRIGDALLEALAGEGVERINYEILGNSEPALHAHIIPRYASEPPEMRRAPAMRGYDWSTARRSDPAAKGPDAALVERIRAALKRASEV